MSWPALTREIKQVARRINHATPTIEQLEDAVMIFVRELGFEKETAPATIERQAPAVAKAQAHSGVTEWKRRQDFYREVQQWGDLHGQDIKQKSVATLLARKGMLISRGRSDSGQLTRQAVKAGWGKNEKGVADNGYPFCTPQLSPAGQDVAWKWINKAVTEHGPSLNPQEVI